MALPGNVDHGMIVGRIISPSGEPEQGKVFATPAPPHLLNATASPPTTITNRVTEAELDADGSFALSVIATDDPDLNPTGWTYNISFRLTSGATLPALSTPVGVGQTVDITTLIPVPSTQGTPITRGLSAYEVAVADGYTGSVSEWLLSLGGDGMGPAPLTIVNDYTVLPDAATGIVIVTERDVAVELPPAPDLGSRLWLVSAAGGASAIQGQINGQPGMYLYAGDSLGLVYAGPDLGWRIYTQSFGSLNRWSVGLGDLTTDPAGANPVYYRGTL